MGHESLSLKTALKTRAGFLGPVYVILKSATVQIDCLGLFFKCLTDKNGGGGLLNGAGAKKSFFLTRNRWYDQLLTFLQKAR
ncbi:MAG: hypothetical protein HZB23_11640 [Deltaproteobacteria bacterium]|nr:hypothetical protein [Deltaproteobacteria bacterium]